MAGARDGDVAETGVEQVWVNAGVGIDQDALGGESLGAVTGDGVAVIEMAMLTWRRIRCCRLLSRRAVICPSGRDGLDDGKVAIGDAKRLVRSGELNAVADGEFLRDFPIDADAGESARIVIG